MHRTSLFKPNHLSISITIFINVILTNYLLAQQDTCNLSVSYDTIKYPCESNYDGWFVAQAYGGTEPYNYEWNDPHSTKNDTITNLQFGAYSITVTDSLECIITDTLLVTRSNHCCMWVKLQIDQYPLTPDSSTGVLKAKLSRNYFPPSNSLGWIWNHDTTLKKSIANDLGLGTYSVSGGFKGCLVTDTIQIDSVTYDTCVMKIGFHEHTFPELQCGGEPGSATFSAKNGKPPYKFYIGQNEVDTIRTQPFDYIKVCTEDSRGCRSCDQFQVYPTCCGGPCGEEDLRYSQISIHPNPTTGLFLIDADQTELRDISGKLILNTTNKLIDLSAYPKGLYFIKALKDDRAYYSKVVKE